jgi:hypothetical protein
MELSAELFEQIVGQNPAQAASSNLENRGKPRLTVGNRAWISPAAAPVGTRIIVALRDLSVKAIGFSAQHPMVLNEMFVLGMTRRSGPPVRVICSVTRCDKDQEDGDRFVIGASFLRIVQDVQIAGGKSTKPAPAVSPALPAKPAAATTAVAQTRTAPEKSNRKSVAPGEIECYG